MRDEGHLHLLAILKSPSIPYDYCETRDGYSLRSLMAQFVDQNGAVVVPPLLEATREILARVNDIPDSFPVGDLTNPENLDISDINRLNTLLPLYSKLLSHLAVLQTIYQQTPNMQGRPSVAHTASFGSPENVEMLSSIGDVVRYQRVDIWADCLGPFIGEGINC